MVIFKMPIITTVLSVFYKIMALEIVLDIRFEYRLPLCFGGAAAEYDKGTG